MAKYHLDRLKKRYGFTGKKYGDLMEKIISNNVESVSRAVSRISNDNYKKQFKKYRKTGRRLVIPNIQEVIPKRSVFTRKGAERGVLLTDALKTELDKQLRSILTDFKGRKKPVYIIRRGAKAGRINPAVIGEFEKRIVQTFTNYTKKDKRYGVPSNVHTIAVTEVRSTISDIKEQYNQTLLNKNKDHLRMFKTWIHNRSLSKEHRPHHAQMNHKTIEGSKSFAVRHKIKKMGRWVQIGWTRMMRPHDPTAPADQVIGCNCDLDYFMRTIA